MRDAVTIGPNDIEVEYIHIDPIIHIYPNENQPEVLIHDLLQGLFLLHKTNCALDSIMKKLDNEKDPIKKQMLMELKEAHEIHLESAHEYAENFYKKMERK